MQHAPCPPTHTTRAHPIPPTHTHACAAELSACASAASEKITHLEETAEATQVGSARAGCGKLNATLISAGNDCKYAVYIETRICKLYTQAAHEQEVEWLHSELQGLQVRGWCVCETVRGCMCAYM